MFGLLEVKNLLRFIIYFKLYTPTLWVRIVQDRKKESMMFILKSLKKYIKKPKKFIMYSILLIILRNLELYSIIKQKLQKKGLLKKLVDNLISHRSKIHDSIRYNFWLVVQNKKQQNALAGLMTADSILSTVYKATSQINGNYWSTQPSSLSQQNRQIQALRTTSYSNPIQSQAILRQLDIRFQLNYLRMVIYILQNFKEFYKHTLDSLLQYASKRTMRITFATETCMILKKIGYCIDTNVMRALSLQVYYHLLKSIKENKNQQFLKDQQRIKTFFELWMKQQNFKEGKTFLLQILKTYIYRSINQSQSKVIQSILISLYDEKRFRQVDIAPLEEVIFQIASDEDFYVRFTKSLLINILSYISYSKDSELLSKQKIILWGISEDYQNNKYKHANDERTKINALIFVHRLAQKQIIDLNETVTYNRYYFIAAYTFNLFTFRSNPRICSQISEQFKNVLSLLNLKSANIILQTLFEELKLEKDPLYQEHIINFIHNLIDLNNLIEIREIDYEFFPKVSVQYKQKINILIIDVGAAIIEYLSKRKATEVIEKVCAFLVSNLQVLMEKDSNIYLKKQFAKKMQNCFKVLYQKGFKILIETYLQCLSQSLYHSAIHTSLKDFFLSIHVSHLQQIHQKKQFPQYFSPIFKEIDMQSENQLLQVRIKLELTIDRFMSQHPLQLNFKKEKQSEQASLYREIFLRYFGKSAIDQRRKQSELLSSEPHFAERQDSIVRRSSSDLSMDRSLQPTFNEIIEVINR